MIDLVENVFSLEVVLLGRHPAPEGLAGQGEGGIMRTRFVLGVLVALACIAVPAAAHEGEHMLVGTVRTGANLTVQAHARGGASGIGLAIISDLSVPLPISGGVSVPTVFDIGCVAVQHFEGMTIWRMSGVSTLGLARQFILKVYSSPTRMDEWRAGVSPTGDLCGAPPADTAVTGIGKFVELAI